MIQTWIPDLGAARGRIDLNLQQSLHCKLPSYSAWTPGSQDAKYRLDKSLQASNIIVYSTGLAEGQLIWALP